MAFLARTICSNRGVTVQGGAGIVVGLAFFSHKVIRCLGTTVCKITPARGFAAEIATATTVAIASRYGEYISSSAWSCLWHRSLSNCSVVICMWIDVHVHTQQVSHTQVTTEQLSICCVDTNVYPHADMNTCMPCKAP